MAARGVVGVDGSASSLAAVEAAAREARWRGAGQHLVHAFIWPTMHVPLGPSELGPPDGGLRNMARRLVAEAEEHARTVAPDVTVTSARRDRGRADGPRSAVPHGAAHGDRLPEHGRRHRPAGGLDRGTPGRWRPLPHPGGPAPATLRGPSCSGSTGRQPGNGQSSSPSPKRYCVTPTCSPCAPTPPGTHRHPRHPTRPCPTRARPARRPNAKRPCCPQPSPATRKSTRTCTSNAMRCDRTPARRSSKPAVPPSCSSSAPVDEEDSPDCSSDQSARPCSTTPTAPSRWPRQPARPGDRRPPRPTMIKLTDNHGSIDPRRHTDVPRPCHSHKCRHATPPSRIPAAQ